jgi:endonuclease/exonuclease/phosphatase family metal-dependent hydrolase
MKKLYLFTGIIFFALLTGLMCKRDNNSFRVMTFNIRYDNSRDSMNAWANRKSIISSFINSEKPDIIGLQEVTHKQYLFLDSVLNGYASAMVGRNDGAKGGEANPVFYNKERFDLVRTKTFWLSATPEIPGSKDWGSSLPRIVTWMELADKTTHEHLFFFNTHFAHDSDSARVMSASLLLTRVDSIAQGFPFVVTGDFNMLPSGRGYSILTGPQESVPLLEDSYFVSDKIPDGPQYTFNGFSDKQGSGRIDYIFIKPGMKVLEHSTSVKKVKGVYISDHWPVEAVISLN